MRAGHRHGFTLIELLIVVAIIAILAAIALPNYYHAQMRARVAHVQADFDALAVAIEAYRVDNNDYPQAWGGWGDWELCVLTSPVPYITRNPDDPFLPPAVCPEDPDHDGRCAGRLIPLSEASHYDFIRFKRQTFYTVNPLYWFLVSMGPDHDQERNYSPSQYPLGPGTVHELQRWCYDPSNGLVSSGEIYRFGPSNPPGLRTN